MAGPWTGRRRALPPTRIITYACGERYVDVGEHGPGPRVLVRGHRCDERERHADHSSPAPMPAASSTRWKALPPELTATASAVPQ